MTKTSLLLSAIILLVFTSSCKKDTTTVTTTGIIGDIYCKNTNSTTGVTIEGTGTITTQNITLSSFTKIVNSLPNKVTISKGSPQKIEATGHSNIISKLKKDVVGDTWEIDLEDGCYKNYSLSINIVTPNIKSISTLGDGGVLVNDLTGTKRLSLDIVGSGDITSGKDQDLGSLSYLNISHSGGGKLDFLLTKVDTCNISSVGSGNIFVYVRKSLDVSIVGSGNVSYKGTPTITKSILGSGKIYNLN